MRLTCAMIAACLATTASGQLTEDLKLTANDAAAGDKFGTAVATASSTAIVGAPHDGDSGPSSGSAYVFRTTTGQQLLKLIASDAAADDEFGISVATTGSTAIVGAWQDDDAGTNSGSAYIFDARTGQQLFKLTASDATANDLFGHSVAISGTTAVVGAWQDDDDGFGSGSAYIFDTTTGQQLFKLTASDAAEFDFFGFSVAIFGNIAIVGAIGNDDAGSAYVFDATTGQELFKLTASDAAAGDEFGVSVAISGGTAIVGADRDDDAGTGSGSAYLFDVATGQQLFKLTAADAAVADQFGRSVAISGTTAVAGAWEDDDGGLLSGSAYAFKTTTGEQLYKLTASDAAEGDRFGRSVAMSSTAFVVGAFGNDDAGTDSGSMYVFDRLPDITMQPQSVIVTAGEEAAFNVSVDGSSGVSYQWRQDAVDLTDSATTSGAQTASLQISAAPIDVGLYDCVVTNTSGSAITAAAMLAVRPDPNPCPGDIANDFGTLNSGDGMVSFGDFLALLGLVGPCP